MKKVISNKRNITQRKMKNKISNKRNMAQRVIKKIMCFLMVMSVISIMITLNYYCNFVPGFSFLKMNVYQLFKLLIGYFCVLCSLFLLLKNEISNDSLHDLRFRDYSIVIVINFSIFGFNFMDSFEKLSGISGIIESVLNSLSILLISLSATITSFVKFKK